MTHTDVRREPPGQGPAGPAVHDGRWTVRRAGVVAGVSLLLMAAAAVFAKFVVLDSMVTPGDGAATAAAILAREDMFRLGVLAWLLVAVLDVVVAWALYRVFQPVSAAVSALSAAFRLTYTAVLLVAVGHLLRTLDVLTGDASPAAIGADVVEAQALLELAAFQRFYDVGLLLFGVHLVLLGYLAVRSGFVPKVVGALLLLAGAGYAVDTAVAVLAVDLPTVSVVTFLGEPLLAHWLLVAGRRTAGHRIPADGSTHPERNDR